jgi:hypothetical protein
MSLPFFVNTARSPQTVPNKEAHLVASRRAVVPFSLVHTTFCNARQSEPVSRDV